MTAIHCMQHGGWFTVEREAAGYRWARCGWRGGHEFGEALPAASPYLERPDSRDLRSTSVYVGERQGGSAVVFVQFGGATRLLPPRLDLARHSPAGFEWGYGGSGPAQLALALLAHALGDERAVRIYHDFKWSVVAMLPRAGWRLTWPEIAAKAAPIEAVYRREAARGCAMADARAGRAP